MKIDSIRIVRVKMPLKYPFRTSFANIDLIGSVLVEVTSGGMSGWGEASALSRPEYSGEWSAGQFMASRDFIAPLLINKDIKSGTQLQSLLYGLKGNYFAKAAFDLAWWDLHAKQQGQPLWKMLGGIHTPIDAGADFGVMDSIEDLIGAMKEAEEQGYKRVKLKYRPGWDLDMVKEVRNEFPHMPVHIDCNSCYTLNDLPMFRELDKYNLTMIEQPLANDDLIDHARLQTELKTAICLDESIVSADKVRKAIQIGACRFVNIKLGRVGGITNALEIIRICEEYNIPCWVGGMLESAVGQSHNVAFATLPNIKYPSDIFPTSRFYEKDLGKPEMNHSGSSQFMPSPSPGIGVIPDEEFLKQVIIEECIL